jgi:hypothetical protein
VISRVRMELTTIASDIIFASVTRLDNREGLRRKTFFGKTLRTFYVKIC